MSDMSQNASGAKQPMIASRSWRFAASIACRVNSTNSGVPDSSAISPSFCEAFDGSTGRVDFGVVRLTLDQPSSQGHDSRIALRYPTRAVAWMASLGDYGED